MHGGTSRQKVHQQVVQPAKVSEPSPSVSQAPPKTDEEALQRLNVTTARQVAEHKVVVGQARAQESQKGLAEQLVTFDPFRWGADVAAMVTGRPKWTEEQLVVGKSKWGGAVQVLHLPQEYAAGAVAVPEAVAYSVGRAAGMKTPEIPPTFMEYGPAYFAGSIFGQYLLTYGVGALAEKLVSKIPQSLQPSAEELEATALWKPKGQEPAQLWQKPEGITRIPYGEPTVSELQQAVLTQKTPAEQWLARSQWKPPPQPTSMIGDLMMGGYPEATPSAQWAARAIKEAERFMPSAPLITRYAEGIGYGEQIRAPAATGKAVSLYPTPKAAWEHRFLVEVGKYYPELRSVTQYPEGLSSLRSEEIIQPKVSAARAPEGLDVSRARWVVRGQQAKLAAERADIIPSPATTPEPTLPKQFKEYVKPLKSETAGAGVESATQTGQVLVMEKPLQVQKVTQLPAVAKAAKWIVRTQIAEMRTPVPTIAAPMMSPLIAPITLAATGVKMSQIVGVKATQLPGLKSASVLSPKLAPALQPALQPKQEQQLKQMEKQQQIQRMMEPDLFTKRAFKRKPKRKPLISAGAYKREYPVMTAGQVLKFRRNKFLES